MCQEMVFEPVCDRVSKELSQTSRRSSHESWLITLVGKFCKWPPLEKWLSLAQLLSSGMILKKYLMTWPIMANLDLDGGIKTGFTPSRKYAAAVISKKTSLLYGWKNSDNIWIHQPLTLQNKANHDFLHSCLVYPDCPSFDGGNPAH